MYHSIRFSGTQGDGVDTVGELLAAALHNAGYWVYAYRNFSSRIRGGYSSHEISFAESPIRVKKLRPDILVCIGEDGWTRDSKESGPDTWIFIDESIRGDSIQVNSFNPLTQLPFVRTAKETGGDAAKWVVALGTVGAHLGQPCSVLESLIVEQFERKGAEVVDKNVQALRAGYLLTTPKSPLSALPVLNKPPADRILVKGSDAVAQAAIAAGCNFTSGYPISPASDVFEYLARHFTDSSGNAVQTEDEMAAITMAIGASFAGATAVVATSGPGFSLMVEGIGLASATKTPLVIVNAQRTGPSTGMPSKHEQSDIDLAIVGGHGDVAPVVFCPSSVEEVYTDLPRAFVAAEKHRTPVIFLTDFALMVSRASVTKTPVDPAPLKAAKLERSVPGMIGEMFHVTGNQQGHNGLPTDLSHVRKALFDKRLALLPSELDEGFTYLSGGAEILIVATGSTRGAVEVAMGQLGGSVSAIFPRVLAPLPVKAMADVLQRFSRILVLDVNATGQLLRLFKTHYPFHDRFHSSKKYDGEPFSPEEVIKAVREVMGNE